MKRRLFITRSVGGALGTGVLAGAIAAEPAGAAGTALFRTPVSLMVPTADGVSAVWAVSELCRGWIEWRPAGGGGGGRVAADAVGFFPQTDGVFRLEVNHLLPGKHYELRAVVESVAGGRREESPWKKFRTLDPAAAGTRFLVWNDTHDRAETIGKLDDASPAADFFIWNGDTCNDWKEEELLIPTLLHPGGRDITRERPLVLVWGNHDVRGPFGFRAPSCVAMRDGRPFSAFRSGPVAVICLHTGEDKPDDHPSFHGRVSFDALRAEQTAWLEEIIGSPGIKDAPYRVVFCHIPLRWTQELETVDYAGGGFDRYSRRSRDAWHDLLVKWGAQVVISGHNHRQTWIPADGNFPYVQVVSGGPDLASARYVTGEADGEKLKLAMYDVDGKVTHEESFPRL